MMKSYVVIAVEVDIAWEFVRRLRRVGKMCERCVTEVF
jgi:hypothetical protein